MFFSPSLCVQNTLFKALYSAGRILEPYKMIYDNNNENTLKINNIYATFSTNRI